MIQLTESFFSLKGDVCVCLLLGLILTLMLPNNWNIKQRCVNAFRRKEEPSLQTSATPERSINWVEVHYVYAHCMHYWAPLLGNPSISGARTSKLHSSGPKEHSTHPQQNIFLEIYHGNAESLVEHHITLLVIFLPFLDYLYKRNFMLSNSDSIYVHTSSSSHTWIVPQ